MGFGITKQVLEQIIACYPNLGDTSFIQSYDICNHMLKCNFKRSFLFATSGE